MKNNYKTAIIIFLLIFFVVPFCHSEKVIRWATQNERQRTEYSDAFYLLTLSYSRGIEEIKLQSGLKNFFENKYPLLLKIKQSPVIFQEDINNFDIPIYEDNEKEEQQSESESEQKQEQEKEQEQINTPKKNTPQPNASKDKNQTLATSKDTDAKIKTEADTKAETKTTQKRDITKINTEPKIKPKFNVLIIGDSFMAPYGGLGTVLERELLQYKDLRVVREGKVSSGLSRPDYFNWDMRTRQLVYQYKPNIAIVFFGSNDGQSFKISKNNIAYYGTNKWNQEYGNRTSSLLNTFTDNNITVFWIGVPIMKSVNLSKKMLNINSIYKQTIQDYENAMFIPTWALLTDAYGNYSDYLPNQNGRYQKARTSDGVHLQYFGGAIITDRVIEAMKKRMELEKIL